MKRVVVTGMGAITPIGNSVETFWNSLKKTKWESVCWTGLTIQHIK